MSQYNRNYFSDLALGNIQGHSAVVKFGSAPSGLQITATDIWDRTDATPTQQIWLAPTAKRVHTLASNNGGDNGAVIRVWGLPDWDTKETYQDITLPNGTTSGEVIIHRMKLLQTAAHKTLLGTVTATAAAPDSTITAVILPGNEQTEMAIYGVPSVQKALLWSWYAHIDKAIGLTASADFSIRVNEAPNLQTTGYIRKADIAVQSTGSSSIVKMLHVPQLFAGPCIIKIQGIASAADVDADAGFSLELVDNSKVIL